MDINQKHHLHKPVHASYIQQSNQIQSNRNLSQSNKLNTDHYTWHSKCPWVTKTGTNVNWTDHHSPWWQECPATRWHWRRRDVAMSVPSFGCSVQHCTACQLWPTAQASTSTITVLYITLIYNTYVHAHHWLIRHKRMCIYAHTSLTHACRIAHVLAHTHTCT